MIFNKPHHTLWLVFPSMHDNPGLLALELIIPFQVCLFFYRSSQTQPPSLPWLSKSPLNVTKYTTRPSKGFFWNLLRNLLNRKTQAQDGVSCPPQDSKPSLKGSFSLYRSRILSQLIWNFLVSIYEVICACALFIPQRKMRSSSSAWWDPSPSRKGSPPCQKQSFPFLS